MARRVLRETIPELPENSHDGVDETLSRFQPNGPCGLVHGMASSDPQLDNYQGDGGWSGGPGLGLRRHKSLTERGTDTTTTSLKNKIFQPSPLKELGPRQDSGRFWLMARLNPFSIMGKIPNPEALRCKRLYVRRNALCDPEKMAMPQELRERIQKDLEHRKHSLMRRLAVFIRVKVGTDGEEDLF